jgi:inhibitor of KinA
VIAAGAIVPAGDSGLLIRLGEDISEATAALVQGALAALDAGRPAGVVDVVPGYATVLVLFDPARLAPAAALAFVERALASAEASALAERPPVEIPVLYDPSVGPDLLALAAEAGMTPEELAQRHAAPDYHCHMLGFRPGFPFLGGLDPALNAARLATPRVRVEAGSVAIGGRQTGVYPSAGPGGWRIIGRTPLRLFRPGAEDPFLVHPGDRVRFIPVDRFRFAALGGTT